MRGEVKVKPLTDDPSRFCLLKSINIESRSFKVDSIRVCGDDVYIKFDGINDRTTAESYRGAFLSIDRASAVSLDEGELFVADLIGAQLFVESDNACEPVGVIRSVQSFGAADVITVCTLDGKEMTFAFVSALCARFDEREKRLTVLRDKLAEVAVYDED